MLTQFSGPVFPILSSPEPLIYVLQRLKKISVQIRLENTGLSFLRTFNILLCIFLYQREGLSMEPFHILSVEFSENRLGDTVLTPEEEVANSEPISKIRHHAKCFSSGFYTYKVKERLFPLSLKKTQKPIKVGIIIFQFLKRKLRSKII